MSLKEQLDAKKKELLDLEPQLKADDVTDEVVEQGEALVKEIGELTARIEKAEKSAKILELLGTTETTITEDTEDKKMSQIEEFTKKCAEISDKKAGARMHFEKAYNSVVTAPQIADVDRSIAPVGRRVSAASLFQETQISGNAITYFLEGAFETNGDISATAQNNKKPQVSTSFAPNTLALSKLAAWLKETDEILTDAPFLASECQNTLMHQLGKVEDNYVINAIGSTVGIGAETYDGTTVTFADGILASIMKVKAESAFDASVVVLNPADIVSLMTAKDSNKQYYGGGYFVGAYGNGAVGIPSSIWGVPIYASSKVSQGSALVAAREAVKTWRKGGMDVAIAAENEDDFLYNRVTLRAEVRLATAVVDLKGVVLLSSDAS
ncbi:MAG: phage major capsid protein [Clostridiales bacterium]|nr:phage major capsid protein [Clostridiales bacterium]